MIKFLLTIALIGNSYAQDHTLWWEKNVETQFIHFATWLGDESASSRSYMRQYIKNMEYTSIADIGCGLCTDYFGLVDDNLKVSYIGFDITPKLVSRARKLGLNVKQGSIENIPLKNSAVDMAYARHILEHLPFYEKALTELIRISRKEVMIIFFIKPEDERADEINSAIIDECLLYHNHYNKKNIEKFLMQHYKVHRLWWENIADKECVLHIILR